MIIGYYLLLNIYLRNKKKQSTFVVIFLNINVSKLITEPKYHLAISGNDLNNEYFY